jgi:predicted Zn-dependent peptidase
VTGVPALSAFGRVRAVLLIPLAFVTFAVPHATTGQSSPGEALPVRTVTLDNGMRILLLPRAGAPTVSFVMQFGIGGVHERLGTTGIAHVLEHMLFKGSETIGTTDVEAERVLFAQMDEIHGRLLRARANGDDRRVEDLSEQISALEDRARVYVDANEFDRILKRAGAQGLNATTNSEATRYFVEMPSNRAELFFALEADRMANPVFREFYTERAVVMEERRMRVETSPGGLLYEAHLGAAFSVHPYGVPVVGYMSDLESLSRADVEDYYRAFYGPNNAVLSVVGNFDPDEVEGWARTYLERVPRGQSPPPVLAVEPRQHGTRRIEVEWDAAPQLRIGWHVPSSRHEDAPALAMLSAILTGGRTARLHKQLVTAEGVATSVFSSMGPGSLYPQLFQIDASPVSPATTEQLEEAIYQEIEVLASIGPGAEELERVANQISAGAVRRIESNLGLAFQLADSESLLGDWRETFRAPAKLRAVTPEDVRRVASQYFRRDNRTVATLVRVGTR